jgi:hypothetical protein
MKIRTAVVALGLAGLGLFTAAPATAQDGPTTTVGCSPCVLWEDYMEGVAALPGKTMDNIRALPGQAAAKLAEVPSFPQQTMDNIKNLPQQAVDNIKAVTGGGDE